MKLLIISDLHIGAGDEFGTFGWNDDTFIQKIKNTIETENIDQVILNGDIYELYKYSYSKIYARHKKLIEFFKKSNFVYIRGNHDFINHRGMDNFNITNSKNQTIHIEHGHNCDLLNGSVTGRIISKILFKLIQVIVKLPSCAKLYHKIVEFDDQINRVPRKYDSYKYLKYALKLLKTHDVVIFGHTHKIESHRTYYLNNKKLYLNSGSCSHGRFQAVTIDTETLYYDTIKISNPNKSTLKIKKEKKDEIVVSKKIG